MQDFSVIENAFENVINKMIESNVSFNFFLLRPQ